jgi:hypothetical protein
MAYICLTLVCVFYGSMSLRWPISQHRTAGFLTSFTRFNRTSGKLAQTYCKKCSNQRNKEKRAVARVDGPSSIERRQAKLLLKQDALVEQIAKLQEQMQLA